MLTNAFVETERVALSAAAVGLLAGRLNHQSADVQVSLVDAAQTYSQRKTAHLNERFTTAEQWLRILVGCVYKPCSEEVRGVARQHAKRALDDLNETVKRFVQPYRGLVPSRDQTTALP